MRTEILLKVADLVVKTGILTTIAYGVKKFSSTPKQKTETVNVESSTEALAEDENEQDDKN